MCKFREHGHKKGTGICFDPLVLSFAMALLSKSLNNVYQLVSKVLYLPDLRTVRKLRLLT